MTTPVGSDELAFVHRDTRRQQLSRCTQVAGIAVAKATGQMRILGQDQQLGMCIYRLEIHTPLG